MGLSHPIQIPQVLRARQSIMSTQMYGKIRKDSQPTQLEEQVSQAFLDLESNNKELQVFLNGLYFVSAKEVNVHGGSKAIVIAVPYPLLPAFQKLQARLVRELEKKFSGQQVLIHAQRRILPKEGRKNHKKTQRRPRSRTLAAVHEALLDDLVYPTEIVGKRMRYRLDQSCILRVQLDSRERNAVEGRLDAYRAAYKSLAGKDVVFEFPKQD